MGGGVQRDDLLFGSQHENRGSEMHAGFESQKVLARKQARITCPKRPLGSLPPNQQLEIDLSPPQHGVQLLHTPALSESGSSPHFFEETYNW